MTSPLSMNILDRALARLDAGESVVTRHVLMRFCIYCRKLGKFLEMERRRYSWQI